jgi:hypothetical protein
VLELSVVYRAKRRKGEIVTVRPELFRLITNIVTQVVYKCLAFNETGPFIAAQTTSLHMSFHFLPSLHGYVLIPSFLSHLVYQMGSFSCDLQ